MIHLGGNLIAIPQEHTPSMHAIWYRVEAFGVVTVRSHGSGYRVHLERPGDEPNLMCIHDDFYRCLYHIFIQLEEVVKKEIAADPSRADYDYFDTIVQ